MRAVFHRPRRCWLLWAAAEQGQPADATRQGQQSVVFRTTHRVEFGERIKICGDHPVLGNWEVAESPVMEWTDGDEWSLTVPLPPGVTDFKCVVVRDDGSIAEWEPGANRNIEVPAGSSPKALEVICPWSNTLDTIQTMSWDEDMDLMDSMGEGVGNGQAGSSSDQVLQQATSQQAAGSAEPAGGNGASTAPTKPVIDDEQVADFLQGSLACASEDAVAPSDSSNGGGRPVETQSTSGRRAVPASSRPTPDAEHSASAAGASEHSKHSGNAGSVHQAKGGAAEVQKVQEAVALDPTRLSAALLGLLAVPVVAWSEYTLKTTGCGLPPGPSGLLGAAEGISYLVVAGLVFWSLGSRVTRRRGLAPGEGSSPVLGLAELLSWGVAVAGVVVLGLQYKEYGYIPAALPDSRCFGRGSSVTTRKVSTEKILSLLQQRGRSAPALAVRPRLGGSNILGNLAETQPPGATKAGPSGAGRASAGTAAGATASASQAAEEDGGAPGFVKAAPGAAAKVAVAAEKKLGKAAVSVRANYNSAIEAMRQVDLSPVKEEAGFVIKTLGEGFAGLGKSMTDMSKQLAQKVVPSSPPDVTQELANRADEVYSGAVDGIDSSELGTVVEELEAGAEALREALRKAWHRAQQLVAHVSLSPADVPMATAMLALPQVSLVGTMMIPTVAANNAAAAANNVNANLNSVILQLSNTVNGIKSTVTEVSRVSARRSGSTDWARLEKAVGTLQSQLSAAKQQASSVELTGLASQLQGAADALKDSGESNAGGRHAAQLALALSDAAQDLQSAAGATAQVPQLVDSAQRAAQALRGEAALPGEQGLDYDTLMKDFDRVAEELQTALARLSSAASKVPTS